MLHGVEVAMTVSRSLCLGKDAECAGWLVDMWSKVL